MLSYSWNAFHFCLQAMLCNKTCFIATGLGILCVWVFFSFSKHVADIICWDYATCTTAIVLCLVEMPLWKLASLANQHSNVCSVKRVSTSRDKYTSTCPFLLLITWGFPCSDSTNFRQISGMSRYWSISSRFLENPSVIFSVHNKDSLLQFPLAGWLATCSRWSLCPSHTSALCKTQ